MLQGLSRPINCIADPNDRNIRREGLNTIKNKFKEFSQENTLKLFNETNLTRNLSGTISDKIEANR